MKGLYGRKFGMAQVFDNDGHVVPVTVLQIMDNVVIRQKTAEKDGYQALVVGFDETIPKRIPKSQQGLFQKNGKANYRHLREIRGGNSDESAGVLRADLFVAGEFVDVCGQSKGKGFQGVVKRYGFGGGSITHGTHNKRKPGSVGQCAWPARIFPGRKMPGRMGNGRVTAENLQIVSVDPDGQRLYVKGSVPGRKGSLLFVREAMKKPAAGAST